MGWLDTGFKSADMILGSQLEIKIDPIYLMAKLILFNKMWEEPI